MKFIKLNLNGAFIIEPEPVKDKRGCFSRLFCKDELNNIGHTENIVQVNHSVTGKFGVVRGLHYQMTPKAEIKIVKCIKGAVFDVIVDIRRNSPTFLNWHGEELTDTNMRMMYVPKGFAHGFQTLKSKSELIYFHSEFYSPEHEGALLYNDPQIYIDWPLPVSGISECDSSHPLIDETFKGVAV